MIVDSGFEPAAPCRGFLVLEGVNGAGKTTLQNEILGLLQERGVIARSTREPGGTELGLAIRSLVLGGAGTHPRAEVLLFAADRAHHVETVIRPALERREWIVSDRYLYSSVAFQGYGHRLGAEMVERVNEMATGGLAPDLVVLLDLDPAEGLRRAASRGSSEIDKFEHEELAFHGRLRTGYRELAERRAEPFLVVDASRPFAEVWDAVLPLVARLVEKWRSGE